MKGRGRPLKELVEEKNPFIAREEFLMNRIVQKNGAAPPWVEIQGGEMDSFFSLNIEHKIYPPNPELQSWKPLSRPSERS